MTWQREGRLSRWAPRPADGWPDHLILFDGVCILCSSWVRFVVERDEARRFRFMRIQSPQGQRLAEALGIDPHAPETNAVILDGIASFKSDAALQVARHLSGMGWTLPLRAIPRPVRDWLYDRVARNRYALWGRSDSCLRPTPELAARLLDDLEPAADSAGGP